MINNEYLKRMADIATVFNFVKNGILSQNDLDTNLVETRAIIKFRNDLKKEFIQLILNECPTPIIPVESRNLYDVSKKPNINKLVDALNSLSTDNIEKACAQINMKNGSVSMDDISNGLSKNGFKDKHLEELKKAWDSEPWEEPAFVENDIKTIMPESHRFANAPVKNNDEAYNINGFTEEELNVLKDSWEKIVNFVEVSSGKSSVAKDGKSIPKTNWTKEDYVNAYLNIKNSNSELRDGWKKFEKEVLGMSGPRKVNRKDFRFKAEHSSMNSNKKVAKEKLVNKQVKGKKAVKNENKRSR